jgi:hypothetical protein
MIQQLSAHISPREQRSDPKIVPEGLQNDHAVMAESFREHSQAEKQNLTPAFTTLFQIMFLTFCCSSPPPTSAGD